MSNSEDPASIKAAEKHAADMLKDITYIMKEPRGRRWVYELVYDACHVDRISHVPTDADATAFNEGGRAVGLRILEELRMQVPAQYMLMLEENMPHGR